MSSLVFLSSLLFILSYPNYFIKTSKASIRFVWPAQYIEHLVLGYHYVSADFFWLRFIQDIGYKSVEQQPTHLGWGYHMAEAITNLDKRYRIVYVAAGTVLSVEVEDKEGARLILEKGIKNITDDWVLPYRAGYHYLYELKDCKTAAKHLNDAAKKGAPYWLSSLAARLYTASGQYDLAYQVTKENLERFKGTYVEKALNERLAEIEKVRSGAASDRRHLCN
ncbi:MAG: hypothetical protein IPM57_02245 [Oligoflexia bacterium]|nr:hypothetical protein [Oligoflexia bacterium]